MDSLPPLESAHLKIDRADKDVRTFDREVQGFLGGEPFLLVREVEGGGREHVYYVEIRSRPPPDLGTAIGNVLHNLRSALDSIVYDVSVSANPTLTDAQQRTIGFPVALEETALNESAMKFAPKGAQEEIKRLQPYNGELPVREHPLWLIHELNRIDKHRFVQAIPALAMGSYWEDPPFPVEDRVHPSGPFDDGAELARFVLAEPHPEVDLKFHPMYAVALPNRSWPAGLELASFVKHISDEVLPQFQPFISSQV
jgi:hypothetical protein